jgi:hypothetical protein
VLKSDHRGPDIGTLIIFSQSPTENFECCQARFVACYGTEEDADIPTIDVEKCGLCGDDTFKKGNFKGATLRLIAHVTAREITHGAAPSLTRTDPAGNTGEREHRVGLRF